MLVRISYLKQIKETMMPEFKIQGRDSSEIEFAFFQF